MDKLNQLYEWLDNLTLILKSYLWFLLILIAQIGNKHLSYDKSITSLPRLFTWPHQSQNR